MVITHGRRRVTMGSTGMTTLTLPSSRRGRRASRTGGSSPSRGVGTSSWGLNLCLFALNLANQLPQWPRSPLIFDTFDSCCSPEGKPVRFVEQEVRCQMSTTPVPYRRRGSCSHARLEDDGVPPRPWWRAARRACRAVLSSAGAGGSRLPSRLICRDCLTRSIGAQSAGGQTGHRSIPARR